MLISASYPFIYDFYFSLHVDKFGFILGEDYDALHICDFFFITFMGTEKLALLKFSFQMNSFHDIRHFCLVSNLLRLG